MKLETYHLPAINDLHTSTSSSAVLDGFKNQGKKIITILDCINTNTCQKLIIFNNASFDHSMKNFR